LAPAIQARGIAANFFLIGGRAYGRPLMSPKELDLIDRLGRISQRINEIADVEARSTLVRGWAAQGNLITEKERLIQRAEEILDQLIREAND
jgi:hypothetical protein